MTALDVDTDSTITSLTGALIDANDRLLGLLALITADTPASLERHDLIDAIIERAAPILELDAVRVGGVVDHLWGDSPAVDAGGMARRELDVAELGTLTIDFCRNRRPFDTGDTKILGAVTKLIANAVATAHMHRTKLEQTLINKEHTTAGQITASALPDPDRAPSIEGLTLFADLLPARDSGGDLFTWMEIDDVFWFAIGDVSGKGLPAAVMMSGVVDAIETSIRRFHSDGPRAVINEVDGWVHQRLSNAAMFVTVAVGCWTPATSTLAICNAGHSPIVFSRNDDVQRIEATSPPVGVLPDISPELVEIITRSGDVLVLATDGFTEQADQHDELFGDDRFDRSVAALGPIENAADAGNRLLHELATHGAGSAQSDDRTLMVVRFS